MAYGSISMKKVFISSVMKGFADERKAAKSAVESLDMQPIMAEHFSAKPYSPRTACVEGVKNSDIYLGILGAGYGSVANSGLSVTEEEFNMARQCGIPILWFVMNCAREPQQEEFYKRISAYEEGYYVNFFNSTTDLVTKITKTLHDIVSKAQTGSLNPASAAKLAAKYIEALKPDTDVDASIGAIIFPGNQSEAYITAIDLGKTEIIDKFLQPALFGSAAIFSPELGTKKVIAREHLSFAQYGRHDALINSIEFHPDGALAWRSVPASERNEGFFTLYSYVIDQDEVSRKLVKFISYSDLFYSKLLNNPYISSFYLTAVMYNLQDKKLGRITSKLRSSISLGFKSMEDPLIIPQKPMKVARTELRNPTTLGHNLMGLIMRAFKTEGLYYSEKSD